MEGTPGAPVTVKASTRAILQADPHAPIRPAWKSTVSGARLCPPGSVTLTTRFLGLALSFPAAAILVGVRDSPRPPFCRPVSPAA